MAVEKIIYFWSCNIKLVMRNILNILIACIISLVCVTNLSGQVKTKVVAHRGHWEVEGSAQNSIASLK